MDFQYLNDEIGNWRLRMRIPVSGISDKVMILLHGWTGDENSMWVFESRLPKDASLLALRGLYNTPIGGYSWHPFLEHKWPAFDDFIPAINSLNALFNHLHFIISEQSKVSLIGFSQGAAFAYSFSFEFPERVASLASLSGFLPDNIEPVINRADFQGMPVYITHGSKDELVPVSKAKYAAEILSRVGARVSYCEENVGHKLSATCFNGMESFFNNI
jgi:phospholipase/carboxylesterase